jgi:hypothetical protein
MTRGRLLREISSDELTDWIALSIIESEEREKAEWERKRNR